MSSIDIAKRSDWPKPGERELLYTAVYGPQTEWFEGENFLPLPPGKNGISFGILVASMYMFLRPKTLLQKPFATNNDHLLASTRYDLHRMPPIDLRKGVRFFLRDAVTLK